MGNPGTYYMAVMKETLERVLYKAGSSPVPEGCVCIDYHLARLKAEDMHRMGANPSILELRLDPELLKPTGKPGVFTLEGHLKREYVRHVFQI